MIRNKDAKNKCTNLESASDYESMVEFSNPYGYNFGLNNTFRRDDFNKMHKNVNKDYFEKR